MRYDAAVGARITWRDAAGLEGAVDLGFHEIFVGRSVECVIRTDDPMTSRKHARIYFQDGRHIIEDMNSSNGVFVGEQRTQSHALMNGDHVRCGNLWLKYQGDQMMGYGAPQQFGGPPPPFPGPPSAVGGPPPPFPGLPPVMGGPPPPAPFPGPPPPFPGPPPVIGGPPPPAPFPGPPPVIGGPPPPVHTPSPSSPPRPSGGGGGADPAELTRLQRRVEQLQSEIRMLRGGGDKATKMEELENQLAELKRKNTELEGLVVGAKKQLADEAGDAKVQRASYVLSQADEVVNGLNDVISELRINVMAAEGEVEQWSGSIPQASFELVRESLRMCRGHLVAAKDLMKQLRATSGG